MKRMKRMEHSMRKKILVLSIIFSSIFVGTTARATLSIIDSYDKSSSIEVGSEQFQSPNITDELPNHKSRAPEPSTLALFGSGIFGMVISFVRKTYHIAKRAFDIVLSILAIIILSPLIGIIVILVKCTSKGPIIYSQIRVGKDGRLFNIYKFRTMKVDAEKTTGPIWAGAKDSRITPIGSFLRKTHMDEIPQFVNVLRGEMSVIGPRPERPVFVEQFVKEIPNYSKRLCVKPGITGLAQVWHRYDETIEDVKKKIKYDLLYIKKICLWTDIRILFRTVRVVFTGEGAR